MKREEGYYWVESFDGEWVIAFFNELDYWQLHDRDSPYLDDSDFTEIDERRIERGGRWPAIIKTPGWFKAQS